MRRHGGWLGVWLGAWLGVGLAGVPGRCVIAPDRWYANGKKTALYDHDWTLIPTK